MGMGKASLGQKNYAIEWYRYFFAFFICILHFKEYFGNPYPFGGAYLAVEFFFLVSGFFLLKTVDEHSVEGNAETSALLFAKSRFIRLYPQYILSWGILAVYGIFVRHSVSFKDLLINYVDEVLMLQMLGSGRYLNAAMWYVSALMIVSVLVFYLAAKNRKSFTHIIAPVTSLLIYSYFYQTKGMLAGVGWNNLLIVRDGFWRAWAGICLGCVIYEIYSYISKVSADGGQKYGLLRTVYEFGTLCLLGVMFYRPGCTVKDFTFVGMMGILILSVMCGNVSEGSYLTRFLSRFKINGSYAYAMYCNHWVINYFIRDFFPGRPFYPMLCVYLLATVIMSVITTKLIDWMRSVLSAN